MYKTNLHLLVSQKQFKGGCLLVDPGGPFYKMKTSYILHRSVHNLSNKVFTFKQESLFIVRAGLIYKTKTLFISRQLV